MAVCLFLNKPPFIDASNARSQWLNNLQQLGHATWYYHQVFHTFPDDICDAHGKPLLSWRVRLLPYVEQAALYSMVKLDKAWDDPASAPLAQKLPDVYRYVLSNQPEPQKSVHFAQVRGKGTFFGEGGPRSAKDIKGDPAKMIMLVDLHEARVVWTQPGDWTYNPAQPRQGLSRRWSLRGEHGFFAVFGDGKLRFVPESISDDELRILFAPADGQSISITFAWYELLFRGTIGWQFGLSTTISLIAIVEGAIVGYRILRGRPTSPGEMWFVILGAQQWAYVLALVSDYTYDLAPRPFQDQRHLSLWFLPSAMGTLACYWPIWIFRKSPMWRSMFIVLLVLLALVTLDAASPHQFRRAEESLLTIGAPFIMAMMGGAMALGTFDGQNGIAQRRWAHWGGIFFSMVPLIWFVYWWAQGAVVPRDMFTRILE